MKKYFFLSLFVHSILFIPIKRIHEAKSYSLKEKPVISLRLRKQIKLKEKKRQKKKTVLARPNSQHKKTALRHPLVIQKSPPEEKGHFPMPEYPLGSLRKEEEGVVIIEIKVSVGQVVETKITRSSGHQLLDQSAINAVKRWKYDSPLDLHYLQKFRFQLSRNLVQQN